MARRLWTSPEISLTLGSTILFALWTWLTLSGRLTWLDRLLRPPFLPPRSVRGQVAEAFSLLTHPVFTLILIAAVAVFSYKARINTQIGRASCRERV